MKIIAKTLMGLEGILLQEVKALGGKDIIRLNRAVMYEGDRALLYKSNLYLSTAVRVLVVKKEFVAKSEDELYSVLYKIPWESIMTIKDTFAIDCISNSTIFTHSRFAALRAKDAIVDHMRDKIGKRPNINLHTPTYRINIQIRQEKITLSLDSSGSSLHMRGYRANTVDAPINEVLAAGVIRLTDWNKESPLLDPMCGSGTLLIEACRYARNIIPQKKERDFGFKRWKSFDQELYDQCWDELKAKENSKPLKIYGQDKALRSVKVTEQNIFEAGLDDTIEVKKKDFFKSEGRSNITIITNPPYDERLKEGNIALFYQKILDKCKEGFPNSKLWVFTGNIEALSEVEPKPKKEVDLLNAAIESKLALYEI